MKITSEYRCICIRISCCAPCNLIIYIYIYIYVLVRHRTCFEKNKYSQEEQRKFEHIASIFLNPYLLNHFILLRLHTVKFYQIKQGSFLYRRSTYIHIFFLRKEYSQ
jgi:hypothetical protein